MHTRMDTLKMTSSLHLVVPQWFHNNCGIWAAFIHNATICDFVIRQTIIFSKMNHDTHVKIAAGYSDGDDGTRLLGSYTIWILANEFSRQPGALVEFRAWHNGTFKSIVPSPQTYRVGSNETYLIKSTWHIRKSLLMIVHPNDTNMAIVSCTARFWYQNLCAHV